MWQCFSPNGQVSHSCSHVVKAKHIGLVRAIVCIQIVESFPLHRYLIIFINLLIFKDIPILRVDSINKTYKSSNKTYFYILTDTPWTVFEDPSIATHQWCHFFGMTMASIGSRILSSDLLNMYRNTWSGNWKVKSFTKGQPWFKLARLKSTNGRPLYGCVRLNSCTWSNLIFDRMKKFNFPSIVGIRGNSRTIAIYLTKVWG